jgi:hypothetical protein
MLRLCLIALGLGFWVAAHADDVNNYFGAPPHEIFRAGIHAHPYAADAARAARIRAGAPQIKACMKLAEVRRLLGTPDFGGITHNSAAPKGVVTGAAWNYVIRERRDVEASYEVQFEVWFDTLGRVTATSVDGIDGLQTVYLPDNRKCG